MSDQTNATIGRIFGDGACEGDGWIIENPDWPKGDLPYRSRCSGCSRCEPDNGRTDSAATHDGRSVPGQNGSERAAMLADIDAADEDD